MIDRDALRARLAEVRAGIADAAAAAGRNVDEITTIVVTKFHPVELIEDLHGLGVRDFGENRHQEAKRKAEVLSGLDGVTWHFVGQLQSNKAKQVRRYADVIHSLDRPSLVDALAAPDADGRDVQRLDCLIQVNLTDDPARGGVADDGLEPLAERVLATGTLHLLGVMAVAPLDTDARRAFERVRAMSDRLRTIAPHATAISAGMSHDYLDAIAEGATHLRIGTAITGKRPDRG